MSPVLGCIADDFTGATDLAGMLVRHGMRAVQTIGVPDIPVSEIDADAVIVALKSRTIPADEAIAQSLEALEWLQAGGCQRFYFKYCSTFDSTETGNIGPVAEALLDAVSADQAIACPAFPENGRTVFKGYLYAGDVLLNESGMQDHPLTPMTDPNLVRVLSRQSKSPIGLLDYKTIRKGADAARAHLAALAGDGRRLVIADATDEDDLRTLAAATSHQMLSTGGSGLAVGMPAAFEAAGLFQVQDAAADLPEIGGKGAIISGSCSRATNKQVARFARNHPVFQVNPLQLAEGKDLAAEALEWAKGRIEDGPVLIYATDSPDAVKAAQEAVGREKAGALVEDALATVAAGLRDMGVSRMVVAGGETSGAVVQKLKIGALRIGPEIDPGVPWCVSIGGKEMAVALKSGNFGGPDFFENALASAP
jgi:uncharacterized protein YgbK (DUF1537 family)